MNDEQWKDLKAKVKEKAKKFSEFTEDDSKSDDLGHKVPTTVEIIEFAVEMGEFRIERTTRPVILDKKTHYHKGAGGANIEYILSEDEMSHKVQAFKKDDYDEWVALEIPTERLSF